MKPIPVCPQPALCILILNKSLMKVFVCVSILSVIALTALSQTAVPVQQKKLAPETVPGKGLDQYDFFFAGEAKTQNMYIVRKGQIVWQYHDTVTKGEISDARLMPNGNILFAHQYGITLINKDKKKLWQYEVPKGREVHTAQLIGKNHIVFIENGDTGRVHVVNIKTGKTVKEFSIPVGNAKSVHGQFRHARLTPKGTLLVAHMDMGKVCEYDINGNQLSSFTVPGVWSAEPLTNGNMLTCGRGVVREITPRGDTVWMYSIKDNPGYSIASSQIAIRRPNGNTVINDWFNQWSGKIDTGNLPLQFIEVTPGKKIVWALQSWIEPFNLGPATIIQFLDDKRITEKGFFGNIK
jgi:hypothetical protein